MRSKSLTSQTFLSISYFIVNESRRMKQGPWLKHASVRGSYFSFDTMRWKHTLDSHFLLTAHGVLQLWTPAGWTWTVIPVNAHGFLSTSVTWNAVHTLPPLSVLSFLTLVPCPSVQPRSVVSSSLSVFTFCNRLRINVWVRGRAESSRSFIPCYSSRTPFFPELQERGLQVWPG